MLESESEFYELLRHKYTVDVRFYLFDVGFRKCRINYGRINETPLYILFIHNLTSVIQYFLEFQILVILLGVIKFSLPIVN